MADAGPAEDSKAGVEVRVWIHAKHPDRVMSSWMRGEEEENARIIWQFKGDLIRDQEIFRRGIDDRFSFSSSFESFFLSILQRE